LAQGHRTSIFAVYWEGSGRGQTNHGNVFFFDKATRTATWSIPEELEEVEAARQKAERESLKRKAEENAAAEGASKKRKKKKAKVVHSIADIEDPELKAAMLDQIEQESKRVEIEEVEVAPAVLLTTDEGRVSYKAMLGEKNINPMAPWDMELPKFVADPRYLRALPCCPSCCLLILFH
jgi:transcription elongation regulator 1